MRSAPMVGLRQIGERETYLVGSFVRRCTDEYLSTGSISGIFATMKMTVAVLAQPGGP